MKSGTIERGWLGIVTQPLNRSYAKYLGKPDLEGVLVSDVFDDSPAKKYGIKQGDVLLNYGGVKLSAEKEDDLNKLTLMVAQTPVGAEKQLIIFRQGESKNLKMTVGEQPKIKADEFETDYGFTAKEITDDMFRSLMLETRDGVFVSFVDVGTVADKANLSDGDIITAINNRPTPDFKTFKTTITEAANDDYVLLSVVRGKERRFALLDKSSIPAEEKTPKEEKSE